MTDQSRFANLRYDDFRRMAQDSSLSEYEKIGFPDALRAGRGDAIFSDIRRKLTNLDHTEQTVLEIGPGCSEPARLMIELCRRQRHRLILVDAPEMLALLPDEPSFVTRMPARYPDDCPQLFTEYGGRVDAINCYSVMQIVFAEGNLYRFFDRSLSLLADGGQMLIGDIPNVAMRKRFLSSEQGVQFHKAYMQTDTPPDVRFNRLESDQLDDAVLLSLVLRARLAGFHAYLLPQPADLPMANRREDLLICKP